MSRARPHPGSAEWEAARAYARERMGLADRAWWQKKRFYLPLAMLSPVILFILLLLPAVIKRHLPTRAESLATSTAPLSYPTVRTRIVMMPFADCKRHSRSQARMLEASLKREDEKPRSYMATYVTATERFTYACDADQGSATTSIDRLGS